MRAIYTLISLLFIFSGCSKEKEEYEPEGDGSIKIEKGYGAAFFGATENDKMYHITITNINSDKVWQTQVAGYSNMKSPIDCKLNDSRISTVMLPAGDYSLEIVDQPQTKDPHKLDITVEEGKCLSINASGYAW